jgi:hypothetical protein
MPDHSFFGKGPFEPEVVTSRSLATTAGAVLSPPCANVVSFGDGSSSVRGLSRLLLSIDVTPHKRRSDVRREETVR